MGRSKLILISGKRVSGKDTFSRLLKEELLAMGYTAEILSTSFDLKVRFCKANDLDLNLFLKERSYKEKHRSNFSKFTLTQTQEENLDAFLKSLEEKKDNDFIIVSDIRSKYDIQELRKRFDCLSVRVKASDEERRRRGWVESEYDSTNFEKELEGMIFDLTIENNKSLAELKQKAISLANQLNNKRSLSR